MKYFISMGSNEGPSEEIMGAALHKLSLMPLLSIGKVSSLYKTPPWGKTDQAEFLNAVIEADWIRRKDCWNFCWIQKKLSAADG